MNSALTGSHIPQHTEDVHLDKTQEAAADGEEEDPTAGAEVRYWLVVTNQRMQVCESFQPEAYDMACDLEPTRGRIA